MVVRNRLLEQKLRDLQLQHEEALPKRLPESNPFVRLASSRILAS